MVGVIGATGTGFFDAQEHNNNKHTVKISFERNDIFLYQTIDSRIK